MSSNAEQEQKQSDGAYADQIIEGHSYDGIQEYDNPMPLWWKALFAITVIWSPIYIGALELGFINHYDESLNVENAEWDAKIAELKKSQPDLTPERIKSEFANSDRIGDGQKVFATNCASCHGEKGEGLIGPNLTDKFWLHGGDSKSIFHTIDKGVLEKGMPAWGSVLGAEDILNVGAFISSIRNTNVKGKAPQGEPFVGEDGGDAPAAGDAKEGAPEAGEAKEGTPDGDTPAENEEKPADAPADAE